MFGGEFESTMDLIHDFGVYHDDSSLTTNTIPSLTQAQNNDEKQPLSVDQRLLNLSTSLLELQSWIPPLAVHDSLGSQSIDKQFANVCPDILDRYQKSSNGKSGDPPIIERALEITQVMVDEYDELEHTVLSSTTIGSSPTSYPSLLLALSCHHRLVDIWAQLVMHMKLMAKSGQFKQLAEAKKPPCFQFNLGTFPATSSTATARFAMTLMDDLLEKLLQSTKKVQATNNTLQRSFDPVETTNNVSEKYAVSITLKVAANRTSSLLQSLKEARQSMNEDGAFG
jgi:hypothetical protein